MRKTPVSLVAQPSALASSALALCVCFGVLVGCTDEAVAPPTAESTASLEPSLNAGATAKALSVSKQTFWWSSKPIDLDKPADNLKAWIKTRGDLNGQDVVFWWAGTLYGYVTSNDPTKPGAINNGPYPTYGAAPAFLTFEGYNIGRFVPAPDGDGYLFLSREAVFYKDPATNTIVDCWKNPYTNTNVSVVHVWNDPVNSTYKASTYKPMAVTEQDGDVMWPVEVPLVYPSALGKDPKYAAYSQNDAYQAIEMFQFFTKRHHLENQWLSSVPVTISWVRQGPWLPWMQMGAAPGSVLYHVRGKKLVGGYNELPEFVRTYVEAHHPEYKTAPTLADYSPTRRNVTSWTYMKQLIDSGQYTPSCTP